jgi:hypothetical protein
MQRLGTLLLFPCLLAAHENHALPRMVSSAKNFLATLSPEQREKALFPFEAEGRFFWHYIPSDDIPKRYNHPRPGLTLREMTSAQKHLAAALLSAGLSAQGFWKTTTIMSLEDVLRVLEKDSGERRNPEKYHFSVFGTPSVEGPWGYRVEGHHVSLHFTVVNGKVTGSPTFLGANPAEVRGGPLAGLRVLAAEEDKGRALLAALTPAQLKLAVVSEKAYPDILTEASRQAALKDQPNGLPYAQLNPTQRKLLHALLDEYVGNLPAELAALRRDRIQKAGARLFFAWAGIPGKGGPHYYRIHAPGLFLVEYDNTQNGANHIHSVWRDFDADWGLDLLDQHYRQSPHHQAAGKK